MVCIEYSVFSTSVSVPILALGPSGVLSPSQTPSLPMFFHQAPHGVLLTSSLDGTGVRYILGIVVYQVGSSTLRNRLRYRQLYASCLMVSSILQSQRRI